MKHTLSILILAFGILNCQSRVENTKDIPKSDELRVNNPKNSILSNDIQYINDSILEGKFKLDISSYDSVNAKKKCSPTYLQKDDFYEYSIDGGGLTTFKVFKNLGDLNGDKKDEYVFVLPGLGWCEEGQSYYFTDNNIPRIQTESMCCYAESIFTIGDIDEDGGNEIAEYYSSCASNFKAISIWTLKDKKWKSIETFTFYYNNGKYEVFKDFHKLYKKISKNTFMFLEISDKMVDGTLLMEWKTVVMK